MLRVLTIASVFLTISISASAQDAKPQDVKPAVAATPSTAEIVFENEVHDFGNIEFGGDGTHAFRFTNTGNDPLIISDAKGSCGCTVPKWPKEAVLKGQSNHINVSYDTKRIGPFTKTVTINSNAKTAVKVLTIKGNVLQKEQLEEATPFRTNNGMSPLEKTN